MMKDRGFVLSLVVGIIFGAAIGTAEGGDVNVTIGAPPIVVAPPPVITAKPAVVVVPGTPVYRAPGVEFNVFLFGGKYYSHHNDVWYVTPRPDARGRRHRAGRGARRARGVLQGQAEEGQAPPRRRRLAREGLPARTREAGSLLSRL